MDPEPLAAGDRAAGPIERLLSRRQLLGLAEAALASARCTSGRGWRRRRGRFGGGRPFGGGAALRLGRSQLAFAEVASANALARFIALNYLGFGLVFLTITPSVDWPRRLFRLPQWALLLPVAALAWAATLR